MDIPHYFLNDISGPKSDDSLPGLTAFTFSPARCTLLAESFYRRCCHVCRLSLFHACHLRAGGMIVFLYIRVLGKATCGPLYRLGLAEGIGSFNLLVHLASQRQRVPGHLSVDIWSGVSTFVIMLSRLRSGLLGTTSLCSADLTVPNIQHYFCLMGFIEFFSLCVAILAVYVIFTCIRCLLPHNIIPTVSTLLNDAKQCVTSAETTGVIPAVSEYRASLETLASDLAQMRIQSHRSPGFSQQIWLAFRCGLTYRLYSLASRIRAVKMRVEIVMDEQLVASPQNVVNEHLPHPPGDIVISVDIPNQTPPPIYLVN